MNTTPRSAELDVGDGRRQLEYWSLDRLVPSPRNARTHSEAQVAEIAGSIRAFGFSNPILVKLAPASAHEQIGRRMQVADL